jgi:hypothetical protein
MQHNLDARLKRMEATPPAAQVQRLLINDDALLQTAWEGLRSRTWFYSGVRLWFIHGDARLAERATEILCEHNTWLLQATSDELDEVLRGIAASDLVCRTHYCWVNHQMYVHEAGNTHAIHTTPALTYVNATLQDYGKTHTQYVWDELQAQCDLKWFKLEEVPIELRPLIEQATPDDVRALLEEWARDTTPVTL